MLSIYGSYNFFVWKNVYEHYSYFLFLLIVLVYIICSFFNIFFYNNFCHLLWLDIHCICIYWDYYWYFFNINIFFRINAVIMWSIFIHHLNLNPLTLLYEMWQEHKSVNVVIQPKMSLKCVHHLRVALLQI